MPLRTALAADGRFAFFLFFFFFFWCEHCWSFVSWVVFKSAAATQPLCGKVPLPLRSTDSRWVSRFLSRKNLTNPTYHPEEKKRGHSMLPSGYSKSSSQGWIIGTAMAFAHSTQSVVFLFTMIVYDTINLTNIEICSSGHRKEAVEWNKVLESLRSYSSVFNSIRRRAKSTVLW
jgi:hypothetical protein